MRCVCDEIFDVARPTELTVRARKCANCGGRIEPGESQCAYCASELTEPDLTSTLCPSCFKRIESSAKHCQACGVSIAPQGLTAIPDGRTCPRCKGGLLLRSLGLSSVIECEGCAGLWVKRDDFESICKRAQERPDIVLEDKAADVPVKSTEPERKVFYIDCPTCGQQMARKMFRYKNLPSHVIIDFCREHGVWFDLEELERIVAFIRSRVDVQVPFDVAGALGSRRPAYHGGGQRSGAGGDWDLAEGLATLFVLDSLGGVLGGIVGSLFD